MTDAEKMLDRAIERNIRHAKRREEQEEREARERQARRDAFWKREAMRRAQKKKLHKEILRWHEQFIKTSHYELLFETRSPFGTRQRRIRVFADGWGHAPPKKDNRCCWSYVYLERPARLRYESGCKWMPIGPAIDLTDAACVKKLTHQYLKRLRDHLLGSAAYKDMADAIK